MDRHSNGLDNDIHVIIVEDEAIIAMDIQQCVNGFGYIVDEVASSSDEALFYIDKYLPNIVLMDIKLSDDTDGIETAKIVQEKHNIPVVYITSHSDENTIKRAEHTKPYGYILKPIDENQLGITIRMALSRYEEEQKQLGGEIINLSMDYTYNIKLKELFFQHDIVSFTSRERDFFFYMVKNINKEVKYEDIIKNIWPDNHTSVSTLRSLVRRVRDKLNKDFIENISSKGYRLTCY